jgi:hypothetical protein
MEETRLLWIRGALISHECQETLRLKLATNARRALVARFNSQRRCPSLRHSRAAISGRTRRKRGRCSKPWAISP